jgi:hypothetical protein
MACDAFNGSLVEHDLLLNVDYKCLVMANKIGNLDDQILVDIQKFILIEMLEKCKYWISQSLMEISYM